MNWQEKITQTFDCPIKQEGNLIQLTQESDQANQQQTNEVFGEKWIKYESEVNNEKYHEFQRNWYLDLYGFDSEEAFKTFLKGVDTILDAGCGLGDKTRWMASLAPHALVIGMDFSDSIHVAAKNNQEFENLVFVKGDIAATHLCSGSIDYVSCDQVIHHTEDPERTFQHLTSILSKGGNFSCYVYAKKALPRELLDEHFRSYAKQLTKEQLWELSEGVTELGKVLTELNVSFECPDIPTLGIKKGTYDIQRFLYWNFLKCYYNADFEYGDSVDTNFDWYAPSNAFRYSEQEYRKIIADNGLEIAHFHKEEACYSGRFLKE